MTHENDREVSEYEVDGSEENLNHELVRVDNDDHQPLTDPACASGTVECHFRDVKGALLREIARWPVVVGCVAWLTDREILAALGRGPDVAASIIVQKEDFLRPDSNAVGAAELRALYARVFPLSRYSFPGIVGGLSVASDDSIGIRCVGNHNRDRHPAFPRAHHKFAVFCDVEERDPAITQVVDIVPRVVWTGSFNWTHSAGRSLENAVVIRDEKVARAYLAEFEQVAALSEPLDWNFEWVEPEWRIGT